LGNGPSLTDAHIPDGCDVIGINRSWMRAWAPIHCIVDSTNIVDLWRARPRVAFAHERLKERIGNYPGLVVFAKGKAGRAFSWDIASGCPISFAGLFALQVALWIGRYKTIRLLGYDEHDNEGRFFDHEYIEESRESHREWFRRVARTPLPARIVADKTSALYPILGWM
jgi:hypothetical protein